MKYTDLHVHTTFCDGKNTPRQMVESAIQKGIQTLGLLVHSYTPALDSDDYCVDKANVQPFIKEINRLKVEYKDKITILCGVERDFISVMPTTGFDYVIGSLHYFKVNGEFYSIDESREGFISNVENVFDGDYYSACENYFETLKKECENCNVDIIGHFDLVRKFNKNQCLFDESNPRYIESAKSAIEKLLTLNKPFEINLGAIYRGYQDTPYPNDWAIEYIKSKGGKFILSSDSHGADSLALDFDKWIKEFSKKGIKL